MSAKRAASGAVPAVKRQRTTILDFFGPTKKVCKVESKDVAVATVKEEIVKKETEPSSCAEVANKEEQGEKECTEKIGSGTLETKEPVASLFKQEFAAKLTPKQKSLLDLEINTMEDEWFKQLHKEFTKDYFLNLKEFVTGQQAKAKVFPPPEDIYSWSRFTPYKEAKIVIIGQDPYHNHNQAHGLAFSVRTPTPAPPSLKNIYKELVNCYPDFQSNNSVGDLTPWAKQGVLLLNTSLTVRAHEANSHSKKGWETFTKQVVTLLYRDAKEHNRNLVFLCWGNNAIKLVNDVAKSSDNILILKSVHPSPLSASRGFFNTGHFKQINDWLHEKKEKQVDWSVLKGCTLSEVDAKNAELEK